VGEGGRGEGRRRFWGGYLDPEKRGWGQSQQKNFSTLRASVWSKNKGEGTGPPGPSPGSATVFNPYHIAISPVNNSFPCL